MKWSEAEERIRNKFGPIDAEAIIDAHEDALWEARMSGETNGWHDGYSSARDNYDA